MNASTELANEFASTQRPALPRIARLDNVLDEPRRNAIWNFLSDGGWKFGWKSDPKNDPYAFWHRHFAGNQFPDHYDKGGKERPYDCAAELSRSAPLLHEFWTKLADKSLPGHRLTRCYANGQPFGSEGSIHTDSVSDRSRTVIYYPHATWHPNWGGETVFFNQDRTDIVASIFPRPNRLVIFAGDIPHVARGLSRTCPIMRITLMFKSEWLGIDAKYRSFLLKELGLDQVPHSGRDFFTHLSGTHALLRAWDNPEPVCLAGLFHSIYGTTHFHHKAFPIGQRHVIRALIGEEAEFLAYVFCVAERPKDFLALIDSVAEAGAAEIELMDHHAKTPLRLTRSQLHKLLEIEAANLIEQGGNVRPALEQIARADVSRSAKRAITEYLGMPRMGAKA
jgi:SM-20-related protein